MEGEGSAGLQTRALGESQRAGKNTWLTGQILVSKDSSFLSTIYSLSLGPHIW